MRFIKRFTVVMILIFLLVMAQAIPASALPVPTALPLGVSVPGSVLNAAFVATSAAIWNQPEHWGVRLTGDLDGEPINSIIVKLSDIDTTTLSFPHPNEANFRVPWPGPGVPSGSTITACVQIVHFLPSGKVKLMGEPICASFGPF